MYYEVPDRYKHLMLQVAYELEKAEGKHAPLHSFQEAYAVLKEEVDEYWDEVKKRTHDRERICQELIQVAAMACRTLLDLDVVKSVID